MKVLDSDIKIKSKNVIYNNSNVENILNEHDQKLKDGVVFSTTEIKIGKWTDGEDLYAVTFDAGYLANNGRTMPYIADIIPATALIKFVLGTAYRSPSPTSGGYNDFIPLSSACSSVLIRPELRLCLFRHNSR